MAASVNRSSIKVSVETGSGKTEKNDRYESWYSNGTLCWYDIYSYDSNGNKMKAEYYNGDGTLSSCNRHPSLSAHW